MIWRYPVMGLQGEPLDRAKITPQGIEGDHIYVVRDVTSGRILNPKSFVYSWGETSALPNMIDLKAQLRGDEVAITPPGESVVQEQRPDGSLDNLLSEALHRPVQLLRYPRILESRVLSKRALHLLTTCSIASMSKLYPGGDFDVRRFRPNVVVSAPQKDNGFLEETWIGRTITIGEEVRIKVEKPNTRCKVTTLRQGLLKDDPGILAAIEEHNGNRLGVMCSVTKEGTIAVGDMVAQSD
jgi:uncharacterized protein YcbX